MFSGKKPDCKSCGFIKIIPDNFEIMNFLDQYLPYCFDGMGSINITNIVQFLKMEQIYTYKNVKKSLFYLAEVLKNRQSNS